MTATLSEVIGDDTVELRAGGFEFTEGPIWDPRDEAVLFSDIPADAMYRWRPGAPPDLFRRPTNKTNGNTFDRAGRRVSDDQNARSYSRHLLGSSKMESIMKSGVSIALSGSRATYSP